MPVDLTLRGKVRRYQPRILWQSSVLVAYALRFKSTKSYRLEAGEHNRATPCYGVAESQWLK